MIRKLRSSRVDSVNRVGVSLVEIVIVMGIASVMLGLGIYTVHLLLKAERHVKAAVWHGDSLSRLSYQFRRDAHAATSVQIGGQDKKDDDSVELDLPAERTVRYSADAGRVVRVAQAAGETRHQDVFPLPKGSAIRFETADDGPQLSLVINRVLVPGVTTDDQANADKSATEPRRTTRIEAVVGRDHRFGPAGRRNTTDPSSGNE